MTRRRPGSRDEAAELAAALRCCRRLLRAMARRIAGGLATDLAVPFRGAQYLVSCFVDDDCDGFDDRKQYYQVTVECAASGAGLAFVFVSSRPGRLRTFCRERLHPTLELPSAVKHVACVELSDTML